MTSEGAKKAWKTRKQKKTFDPTPFINKEYDGPGKTKFRAAVVDYFNKQALTLCLESEQFRFVDALPYCQHIVYEREKPIFDKLSSSGRKNIKVIHGSVSESISLLRMGIRFEQAFLDFLGTYDTLEAEIEQISALLSECKTIAFTFSMRSPSKGKTITIQQFRIAIGLKKILPYFDIVYAESYADGAAMLGLILKKNEMTSEERKKLLKKAQSDADRVRTALWKKIREMERVL